MNLHAIANTAVSMVNPNETVIWYRCTGQDPVAGYGVIKPTYAAPVTLKAQVQSESDAALFYADRVGQNHLIRKFYLFADAATPPAGIRRPDARGGDFLQREDGGWWYITAVLDDFSAKSGWVCVRAEWQVNGPELPEPEPEPEPTPEPEAEGNNGVSV